MRPVTKRPKARSTIPVTTPAPYKGLNTVDALSAMDPDYALAATNFVATPQGLAPRQGFRKHAIGLPTVVTSLLPYHSGNSGSSKHFAVSGSGIYDVTASGTVGAPVVSGLNASSPYWQYTSQTFTTSGAHYLVTVNGADMPLIYDGTTWTACTQVTTPAAPGQFKTTDNNGVSVNASQFIDVLLHQQRLWFVKTNSTVAYYCDIGQVGGNLYAFDFGPLFPRGGKLFKLATWTVDTGSADGTQPILVAISDKGDTVTFRGNNPATPATWAFSGYYQIGSPIGRRCTTQYQGDLLILSQDGLYPLSKYLGSQRVESTAAVTYTIGPTISNLVSSLSNSPGFELCVYPGANVLMLNIPQQTQANNFQFVFHTITKGWTQFTGWPAQCYSTFNDTLYFGGPGYVGLGFIGYKDGADASGQGGNAIVATALSAFTAMNSVPGLGYGIRKHVKQVKPSINSGSANQQVSIGVNVDFNLNQVTGVGSNAAVAGGVWDTSNWDSTGATWVGSFSNYSVWQTVLSYPGEFLAVAISLSANTDTLWISTSWMLERAGQTG